MELQKDPNMAEYEMTQLFGKSCSLCYQGNVTTIIFTLPALSNNLWYDFWLVLIQIYQKQRLCNIDLR